MENKQHLSDEPFSGRKGIEDPYQVITAFFDYCSLSSHRQYITTWLAAVNASDYWRGSSPADLLFYYELLNSLIRAVYRIYAEDKPRKTAVDLLQEKGYKAETNLLHPALYFNWEKDYALWEFFPRSLSLEEYVDPYIVLRNFFTFYNLAEWEHELHELLSDGLSRNSASVMYGEERDILLIRDHLEKLIDAVHLIDVRRTEHETILKKNKPFKLDKPCDEIPVEKIMRVHFFRERKAGGEKGENTERIKNDQKGNETGHSKEDMTALIKGAALVDITIHGNCVVHSRSATSVA